MYIPSITMTIISSTEFRKDIARYLRTTHENIDPLIVTTQNQEPVVIIPLKEWESIVETQYLKASPANKKRLDKSIKDIQQGKYSTHKLMES